MLAALLLILVAAVVGLPRVLEGDALTGGWVAAAIVGAVTAWALRPIGRRKRS
jgi:hypothetical protein